MPVDGAPQNSSTLTDLFSGKRFIVPDFQRNYAWDKENRKDFWKDIKEGLKTDTAHYWGTITLQRSPENDEYDDHTATPLKAYEVVDGQQRLTTFVLFLLALSRSGQEGLREKYIKTGEYYRLELGPLNDDALKAVIDGEDLPEDLDLKTNRRLTQTYEYFSNQIEAFGDVNSLARYIQGETFCLEFKVEDEELAISAFQSLNDRGRPLSLLDKAKSFLMFTAVKHLDEGVGKKVRETFGRVLRDYDHIEEIAESEGVEYIRNPRYRFSESELLRLFYHYFGRYAIQEYGLTDKMAYDYSLTTEDTFDGFLKDSCSCLQGSDLEPYVLDYLENFRGMVRQFREAMDAARTESPYRRLLCFLGINASVYPLLLSACAEGIAEDLFELLEVLDLRVYKVRGTNPRASLYRNVISNVRIDSDVDKACKGTRKFIQTFMGDDEFRQYLRSGIDDKSRAVKYILWHYQNRVSQESDYTLPEFDLWDYELYQDLEVEHIFPQSERIALPGYGFQDEEEYLTFQGRLGNLTLLESALNSSAGDESPEHKTEIYQKSEVPGTSELGYELENEGFNKARISERTDTISEFCLERWPIP